MPTPTGHRPGCDRATSPSSDVSERFVTEPDDDRLAPYRVLTDRTLRDSPGPDAPHGRFLAESRYVVERLLATGSPVLSVLLTERRVERARGWLAGFDGPVFVVSEETAEAVAGYPVHRGVLATVARPRPRELDELAAGARLLVYLDALTDTENVGSIFRSAAALGVDGLIVGPTAADPLYRRCVRVSMGASALLPWTRDRDGAALSRLGEGEPGAWHRVALSPDGDVTLEEFAARATARTVVVVGTEGAGLGPQMRAGCDELVSIPVRPGTDSLNVATATAIALYRLAG
ncbi:MAG: RNA methyltransferase [Microthrixaceae bacterium]